MAYELPGQRRETVKRANLSSILRELHNRGPVSRSELGTRTGLTRSAVRGLIGELALAGLVTEERGPQGTPGRPSPLVRPSPRCGIVLALEITVDSLAVAAVAIGGEVLDVVRLDRPRDRGSVDETVADLAALARRSASPARHRRHDRHRRRRGRHRAPRRRRRDDGAQPRLARRAAGRAPGRRAGDVAADRRGQRGRPRHPRRAAPGRRVGRAARPHAGIDELVESHAIVGDLGAAAALALEAGIDVELPSTAAFGAPLAQALAAGDVDPALVDRAVARVLAVKFELGLFEAPYVDASPSSSSASAPG
jgi:DNA-binding transcriptional ArsR family regulator